MLFIDGSNLRRSVQRFKDSVDGSFELDYVRLVEMVSRGRPVTRAHYFGSYRAPLRPSDTAFHAQLGAHGYEVHTFPRYAAEKQVDVALAVEMVDQAWQDTFDYAILVSGDQDFVPAVDKVRSSGKSVEVAAFASSLSSVLRDVCDDCVVLDLFPDQLRKP